MATIKKKPSAAQIRARKLFAQRAKAGAFRRKNARTGKRRRNVEMGFTDATGFHPIRASADYDDSVDYHGTERPSYKTKGWGRTRVRAAKKSMKGKPKPRRKNWTWAGTLGRMKKAASRSSYAPPSLRMGPKRSVARVGYRKTQKGRRFYNPLRFKSEAEYQKWAATTRRKAPVRRKAVPKKKRGMFSELGKSIVRGLGMAHNPSKRQKRERRIVRAKRQRVIAFKQHGIRQRGRRIGPGRLPNPSPSTVFSEFRGKGATTKTKATAAKGTPPTLAKLGSLQELHVRGKKLHFGSGASLAADGRKKLHIVGAKFKRPNPPGEIDYGEILSVVYRADKPHIEAGTYDYKHHFGEDGGKRPHLIVDDEGYPKVEGGSYKISADGIID